MRRTIPIVALLAVVTFVAPGVAPLAALATTPQASVSVSQAGDADLVGYWQGVLEFSGLELRIVFRVARDDDGTLTALMDSPDQGASDVPVDSVAFENGEVRFEVGIAQGHYDGVVADGGGTIEGTWSQGGLTLPLELVRHDEPPVDRRPQEPMEPFPYRVEEVSYENAVDGITLAGTLTLPESGGPFPAAILVSGSGPQDRDETVFNHRPFLVLADHLTRAGIAVLRVDDRGVGGSTGSVFHVTSEDLARDVAAGVEFLKVREEIDHARIGLVGHSEGGVIAPIVAAESDGVAFIVLLAGTGLPGEEILYLQAELIAAASGASNEEIEENRATQESIFAILKEGLDEDATRAKLRAALTAQMADLSDEEREALGPSVDEGIDRQVESVMSPWFRFFLTHDPRPVLARVSCPVLALGGEKDLQVPPGVNLDAIARTLEAGGNSRVETEELPGLNHLFQTAETGAPYEYARIEETMSPVVLERISAWIIREAQ